MEEETVNVRKKGKGQLGTMKIEEFVKLILNEVENKVSEV